MVTLFWGHEILESRRIDGAVLENLDRKRYTVHAPPLTVEAVTALELVVMDPGISKNVRIVAGFALFCVGARLRH